MKSNDQKIADKKVDKIVNEAAKDDSVKTENVEITQEELMELIKQLADSRDKEQRALADYQNLVRRTQDERSKIARLAAKDFVEDLIQPLAHLSLASEQINEVGLNTVVSQLWQVLEQNGLKKIDCLNKKFDIELMEVIDKGKKGNKVVKIVKDGYILNNEVIQHAKVILD
ncbi:MAG: nucleotide exchange factor GrpE [Candidatus Pacebacteria bacterium CG_4_10_14_3_um_filter_34_15]|nr:nucleotide exchange factor GrpE [Candidatus Pacearchaeota archaeon]NCQ65919.1 nucleotide exchange factor GrpE [Candidatus Paceibacterota bacterium]OIO44644.1 MAG: nucleotide exchange factor GrpE [Candidatus Pacebacteria bacterium CG1_02_43_31]PIQ80982.1 MAG: nucleotide exchange factor GrpE [Candidatus Pacebacteria bacterium CG11_big_fil_rev_8_21_14_0_20_34_55]PIX81195.1 MAG: nucleotide exchange factor GrpE [Candidatus Pacebacteria bacterium CG_4_10_14_3_um_filter_34_15]PJC43926.1 MAG: nucle